SASSLLYNTLSLILCLSSHFWTAFYLPGLVPVSFCEDGKGGEDCQTVIQWFVDRLVSVESVLPYEFDVFDFCKDAKEMRPSESLGQAKKKERSGANEK
uniref:Uncharacterized protein n=1 Tax=Stegastes partitus TaxID=144197 RepID=A0A3B5AP16_9TELE